MIMMNVSLWGLALVELPGMAAIECSAYHPALGTLNIKHSHCHCKSFPLHMLIHIHAHTDDRTCFLSHYSYSMFSACAEPCGMLFKEPVAEVASSQSKKELSTADMSRDPAEIFGFDRGYVGMIWG